VSVLRLIHLAEQAFHKGKLADADGLLRQIIREEPGNSKANELLAYIAGNRGELESAFDLLRKATASVESSGEAFYYLGTIYLKRKSYAEAAAAFERALAIGGDFFEGLHDLGAALAGDGQHEAALHALRKARAMKPGSYEVHYNIGKALDELKRRDEALRHYDAALELNPACAAAWSDRAAVLNDLKRHDEALISYDRALALQPAADYVYGDWLHSKMLLCDWTGLEEAFEALERRIMQGQKVATPFPTLATPASAGAQRRCAETYVADRFAAGSGAPFDAPAAAPDRLRIGYFSADFRNHATAYLMAELFERHDRSRFELIGFSFGPDADDAMRRRLQSAFDRFLDVRSRTDRQIAESARALGLHIAVDLKGFTTHGRPGVFARRAAPIQVAYLGYPGTSGASHIDYLVADPTLVPSDQMQCYSEKIAYLPHSYQVNGSGRQSPARTFTRAELGLSQSGFVFACFNNNYKITPRVFDIWMRLLLKVPGSALWLFEGNPTAALNLRKEAQKRGVAPQRLVFARPMALGEHLARHQAADLFLDTFHYNAHTTASDALWTGLPVLTCLGETFAGRVAASLLNAVGLSDLITHSPHEYEALALELATDAGKLAGVRARLQANRPVCALFDTERFARDIEALYAGMWQRYAAGLSPEHLRPGGGAIA
jgi:protein O-GlcNAc transferase